MSKDTGGPAFPAHENWRIDSGMTLRQYAAIKLRVPDSGTDWLDEMIGKSLRDDFAAKAMPNFIELYLTEIWNQGNGPEGRNDYAGLVAKAAYFMADSMLAERSKP